MQCYCNDISKINKDIETLKNMLSKINTMSGKDSTQDSTLARLSSNAASAVTPDNIQSLTEKTSKLNTKISDNRSAMSRRVDNEINTLNNKLSNLKTADKNYHDSQLAKGK